MRIILMAIELTVSRSTNTYLYRNTKRIRRFQYKYLCIVEFSVYFPRDKFLFFFLNSYDEHETDYILKCAILASADPNEPTVISWKSNRLAIPSTDWLDSSLQSGLRRIFLDFRISDPGAITPDQSPSHPYVLSIFFTFVYGVTRGGFSFFTTVKHFLP